jgi:hypothetical protein
LTTEKQCSKCGEVKALELFTQRNDRPISWCRECDLARKKVYREANPEKVKYGFKVWYSANSEKMKATSKAWIETHKDRYKARRKAYREKHYDKEYSRSKIWRENLTDGYVIHRLGIKKAQATPELINLKRSQLELIRLIKKVKHERSKLTENSS